MLIVTLESNILSVNVASAIMLSVLRYAYFAIVILAFPLLKARK